MTVGKIKRLLSERGFGFIETADADLFFHCSVVAETPFEQLHEGQPVEFEKGIGADGKPHATIVKPVSNNP